MSWMSTGYETLSESRKEFGPDRFWIPAGQSREIVFVDALPAVFKEHQARVDGNWRNWISCAAPLMDENEIAPCCSIIGDAYQVSMFTIIDCSKWSDKKGNSRQYEIKLLPAKYKTAMKLRRKNTDLQPDGKSIVGRLYKVVRETDKSPSVGDEYEYVRDVDMSKLAELVTFRGKKLYDQLAQASTDDKVYESLKRSFGYTKDLNGELPRKLLPYLYEELFHPKQPKEIKMLLRNFKPEDRDDGKFGGGGSGGGGGGGSADETVPF